MRRERKKEGKEGRIKDVYSSSSSSLLPSTAHLGIRRREGRREEEEGRREEERGREGEKRREREGRKEGEGRERICVI